MCQRWNTPSLKVTQYHMTSWYVATDNYNILNLAPRKPRIFTMSCFHAHTILGRAGTGWSWPIFPHPLQHNNNAPIRPRQNDTVHYHIPTIDHYHEHDWLRGAIKKFSAWLSSVQNKIKILFASCSSKAYNTTCTIWLLSYKYFVHFCVWTQCLSDGCRLC